MYLGFIKKFKKYIKLKKLNKAIKYCESQKLSLECTSPDYFKDNSLEIKWHDWDERLKKLILKRDDVINSL